MPTTFFRARHVATMTQPLIQDGVVAIEAGRIVAVGSARQIDPPRVDHDIDGLLMPGLINAHTHLELTNVPRPAVPGTFQEWLLATMSSMREADLETFNRKREEAVRHGVAQCLKFGVTAVGDISQNVGIVRPMLSVAPIRSVSYGECLGLGGRRGRFDELLAAARKPPLHAGLMHAGVSPHAPYTVDGEKYGSSYSSARDSHALRWATHLAESPAELEFVRDRAGPFREMYSQLGFDPGPGEPTDATTIIEWLYRVVRPLAAAELLVHVNYCSDSDLDLLAHRRPLIAFCPRTHAYFGHPPHRWKQMLDRGLGVCVATDSCASSGDLNVVDDLRLLHRQYPEVAASSLWQMVTVHPECLFRRLPSERTFADFSVWPTRGDDPLQEILEMPDMLPSGVFINGRPVPDPV